MARSHPSELRLSAEGRAALADREGMRLKAYKDSVGVWTIGLGHTSAAGPPRVTPDMTITEDEAWEIFRNDAARFRQEAHGLIKVPLEQHEYDALVSFIWNVGVPGFARSTVLKRLNAGDYAGAGDALLMWNKPPEIQGRRRGEHKQFMKGEYVARA